MVALSTAVDALLYAARNLHAPLTDPDIELVSSAVDRVRTARNHFPLMFAYARSVEVETDGEDILRTLGTAANSLRIYVGLTEDIRDDLWTPQQVQERLRQTDETVGKYAAAVLEAIEQL